MTSSHEIQFIENENLPINEIQRQFIMAAEKQIQTLDLITRRENELLRKIKDTLPREVV